MRALLVSALLLASCQTSWREGASVTAPSGQRLCAKHHIPLITARGYEPPVSLFAHENDNRPFYNIVGQHSPNCIRDYQTLYRTKLQRMPAVITYCSSCEKELRDGLRVPDQAAAIKFAAYALPIYGGAGVSTQPPYHISFRDGIWTVTCSLVNGRIGTIKISKEEGRVISTHYSRNSSNQVRQPNA